jgi:hypothetical protein
MDNPEKLGTRDTGQRHTKQKTQWIIQRNWEHETQDQFLWIIHCVFCFVCLRPVSHVPSFCGLSIVFFVLYVFVLCLSCCQFLWIIHCVFCFVCLRPVSCVPRVASFSGLSIVFFVLYVFVLCLVFPVSLDYPLCFLFCMSSSSREIGNTRNMRHRTKTYKTKNTMDNPEKLATRGTQDTGRRHTLRPVSRVPSFCGLSIVFFVLYVFVLCLVFLVLPVSLDYPLGFLFCMSPEKLATRGTQDTGRRHTKQKTQWIIQRNWEHETQDEDIQNKKNNG